MQVILPTWQAPKNIRAFTTTRHGGVSTAPFDTLNLGAHVGDDPIAVEQNRVRLQQEMGLPQMPHFLNQTHTTNVLTLPSDSTYPADASYTTQKGEVCLVMTADCLPVLFCNKDGTEIAAAHAGWRGLCDGILENIVAKFKSPRHDIMVWLAPAISQKAFQVSEDLLHAFMDVDPHAEAAFIRDPLVPGKYLADLYLLAKQRLHSLGITNICGGEYCTFTDKDRFFSYRREKNTGRIATLIWME